MKQFIESALNSYRLQHDENERLYNATLDKKYIELMAFYKTQIEIAQSELSNY